MKITIKEDIYPRFGNLIPGTFFTMTDEPGSIFMKLNLNGTAVWMRGSKNIRGRIGIVCNFDPDFNKLKILEVNIKD